MHYCHCEAIVRFYQEHLLEIVKSKESIFTLISTAIPTSNMYAAHINNKQ